MAPETIIKPSRVTLEAVSPKERKNITSFRTLLLANDKLLGLLPEKFTRGNVFWEEIESVGFNPEFSRVEAIVNIKRDTGYSGNLCSIGSPEFVRFFIDWNDGNGFEDLGISSFRAHDIANDPPGPQHPLSYMVSKEIDDFRKREWCRNEVIITVRAVLSWNILPSTNPDILPYYGNRMEAKAVLKPYRYIFPNLALLPDKVKAELTKANNGPVPPADKFDLTQFVKVNLDNNVTADRTVSQLMALSTNSITKNFSTQLEQLDFKKMGIDFSGVLSELENIDFNIQYEELVAVGLNSAQDTLGAVINIKRPKGYGGSLCNRGSHEYVSFFADFNNNGLFEQYLGTTSVKVNDIDDFPDEGLNYAVFLNNDFTRRLKYCPTPQVVRIRAILSWATPPSTNPEQPVKWGNLMDVLVQLRPKRANQDAAIFTIGGVETDEISPVTSLAYPGSSDRGNNRPWGGAIRITGSIDNLGIGFTKYRVEYSKNGVDYFPVTLRQRISTYDFLTYSFTHHILEDPNGWFPYLERNEASHKVAIVNQVLATWPSHSFEGLYYLRISYTHDPLMSPASIEHSSPVRIQLDNKRFNVGNSVDTNNTLDAEYDIDMTVNGGVCQTYSQKEDLSGAVKVKDRYYGGYSLDIQPASQIVDEDGLIQYAPGAILNNFTDGEQGPDHEAFAIDLSKLNKCAYTLRLRGFERTILNNSHSFPHRDKYVGFAVN